MINFQAVLQRLEAHGFSCYIIISISEKKLSITHMSYYMGTVVKLSLFFGSPCGIKPQSLAHNCDRCHNC